MAKPEFNKLFGFRALAFSIIPWCLQTQVGQICFLFKKKRNSVTVSSSVSNLFFLKSSHHTCLPGLSLPLLGRDYPALASRAGTHAEHRSPGGSLPVSGRAAPAYGADLCPPSPAVLSTTQRLLGGLSSSTARERLSWFFFTFSLLQGSAHFDR